jgi:hypothetical protein
MSESSREARVFFGSPSRLLAKTRTLDPGAPLGVSASASAFDWAAAAAVSRPRPPLLTGVDGDRFGCFAELVDQVLAHFDRLRPFDAPAASPSSGGSCDTLFTLGQRTAVHEGTEYTQSVEGWLRERGDHPSVCSGLARVGRHFTVRTSE